MKWLGCLGVLVVLALVVGGVAVGAYNNLVGLGQGVDAQWAQVENQYQRRADLVPNLVATVKGAADFEKSTLEEVVKARASVGQATIDPKNLPNDPAAFAKYQQAQDGLSSALSRLLVVVERYPELKANANFRDLQTQLEGTENRVDRRAHALQREGAGLQHRAAALPDGAVREPARDEGEGLLPGDAGQPAAAERQLQLRRLAVADAGGAALGRRRKA